MCKALKVQSKMVINVPEFCMSNFTVLHCDLHVNSMRAGTAFQSGFPLNRMYLIREFAVNSNRYYWNIVDL